MSITVVSKGAVAKVDSQREVHPVGARKILEKEYRSREMVLKGEKVKSINGGEWRPLDRIQDPQMLRQNYQLYKKNYERGLPVKLDPATRNSMWKKAKQLKDEIVVGMVRKSELHPVRHREIMKNGKPVTAVVADKDKMESGKVIERHRAWQKKNSKKVNELKNILRTLEPDNPKIANIERFRPA